MPALALLIYVHRFSWRHHCSAPGDTADIPERARYWVEIGILNAVAFDTASGACEIGTSSFHSLMGEASEMVVVRENAKKFQNVPFVEETSAGLSQSSTSHRTQTIEEQDEVAFRAPVGAISGPVYCSEQQRQSAGCDQRRCGGAEEVLEAFWGPER